MKNTMGTGMKWRIAALVMACVLLLTNAVFANEPLYDVASTSDVLNTDVGGEVGNGGDSQQDPGQNQEDGIEFHPVGEAGTEGNVQGDPNAQDPNAQNPIGTPPAEDAQPPAEGTQTPVPGAQTPAEGAQTPAEGVAVPVHFVVSADLTVTVTTVNGAADVSGVMSQLPADKTFKGWFDAASGGTQITAFDAITSETTVYAQYEEDAAVNTPPPAVLFKVTFIAQGVSVGELTLDNTGKIADPATIPAAPQKGTQSSTGWSLTETGAVVDLVSHVFTADTTVYAQYEAVPTVTVTFSISGQEPVKVPADAQGKIDINAIPAVPQKGTQPFTGWSLTETGAVLDIAGHVFTADTTVYAQYEAAPAVMVTFSIPDQAPVEIPVDAQGKIDVNAIPAPAVQEGKEFLGWSTTPVESTKRSRSTLPTETPVAMSSADVAAQQFTAPTTLYAVIGGSSIEYTVTFTKKDGSTVAIQTTAQLITPALVRAAGLPYSPEDEEGFNGWFSAAVGGDIVTFSDPITDNNLVVYAQYKSSDFTVQFTDEKGTVLHTESVASGGKVTNPGDLSDKGLIPPVGSTFQYWMEKGTETEFNFDTVIAKDTVLVPKFNKAYYVNFHTEGGPVDPILVSEGQSLADKNIPATERVGYTFKHWSTVATVEGGEQPAQPAYVLSTPITAETNLYAVWEPKMVDYLIVYWLENKDIVGTPGPNDYTSYKSVKAQAPAGSKIDMVPGDKLLPASEHQFYEYARTDPLLSVSGNGDSVLNVRYNRKVYTMSFTLGNFNSPQGASVDWTWNTPSPEGWEGTRSFSASDGSMHYSFRAKWEQDVSALWPSLGSNVTITIPGGEQKQPVHWSKRTETVALSSMNPALKVLTLTADLIPAGGNTTQIAMWYKEVTRQYNVSYWFETLDGSGASATQPLEANERANGVNPEGATAATAGRDYAENTNMALIYSGASVIHVGDPQMGYDVVARTFIMDKTTSPPTATYKFYHNRKKLNVIYNNTTLANTEGISHGAALTSFMPSDPVKGTSKFLGWFYDAEFTRPVNVQSDTVSVNTYSATTSELHLYAKWETGQHTVTFFDKKGGTEISGATQKVADGKSVLQQELRVTGSDDQSYVLTNGAEVPGYGTFKGLRYSSTTVNDNGFSYNMPIRSDITVYAVWSTGSYNVTYLSGEATGGTVPVDSSSYGMGSKASALGNTGDLEASGKYFVGWTDQSGKFYSPGALVTITGNMLLTAKFQGSAEVYTVTYKPGFTGGPADKLVYVSTSTNKLALLTADTFSNPDGKFVGWKDESGTTHQPGAEILVQKNMTFTAQWEALTVNLTITTEGGDKPYTGLANTYETATITSGALNSDHRIEYAAWPTLAASAGSVVEKNQPASIKILDKSNNDVSGQYNVTFAPGKLTRTKANLTVTADRAEKWVGEADPAFTAKVTGWVGSDAAQQETILGKINVTRLNAGTEAADIYQAVLVPLAEKTPANYKVIYVRGDFEIKALKGDLAVTSTGSEAEYDGAQHTIPNATATIGGVPATAADNVTIRYWNETTSAYDLENPPKYTDVNRATADDSTGSYTIKFQATKPGYSPAEGSAVLTINPKAVTITPAAAPNEKFAGTTDLAAGVSFTHTLSTPLVNANDLGNITVSRPDASDNMEAAGEQPGAHALSASYTQNKNYAVTVAAADLTIKALDATMEITVADATKVYDNTPLTLTAATTNVTGAIITYSVNGGAYSATLPSRTDAGLDIITVKAVKNGYSEKTVTVKLNIDKRPVTLEATGTPYTKQYQGEGNTPLPDPAFTHKNFYTGNIGAKGLINENDLGTITLSRADKAETPNTYPLTWNYTQNPNYVVSPTPVSLEITGLLNTLAVAAPNATFSYDGAAHTILSATATVDGQPENNVTIKYWDGTGYTLAAPPTQTDVNRANADALVGSYTIRFQATKPGYQAAEGSATLTIEPRIVNINPTASRSFKYADDPSDAEMGIIYSYEILAPGLVKEGDLGVITAGRAPGENVGNYMLTVSYTKNKNYAVNVYQNTFIIRALQGDLTVADAKGLEAFYNAQTHTLPAASASIPGATVWYKVGNGDYSQTLPTRTQAGSDTITVKATMANYADSPEVTVELKVNARPVTLTGKVNPDFKYFDQPDPVDGYTADATTTVNDGYPAIIGTELGTLSAARVSAGETVGKYTDIVPSHSATNANYAVTLVNGPFEIKAADGLAVSATNYNEKYDGQPHGIVATSSMGDATIKYSTAYSADPADYADAASAQYTDVTGTAQTVYFVATKDGYNPAFGSATVNITTVELTLRAKSYVKGPDDADPTFETDPVEGLVNGEKAEDFVKDIQIAREKPGENTPGASYALTPSATLALKPGAQSSNYTLKTVPGTLTVKEFDNGITLDTASLSDSKQYTAKAEHTFKEATATWGGVGTAPTISFQYGVDGATYNSYAEMIAAVQYKDVKAGGDGNAAPYTATVTASAPNCAPKSAEITLTITKAPLKLSAPKTYEKFTNESDPSFTYTVDGILAPDTEAGVLGTITLSRENPTVNAAGTYAVIPTPANQSPVNYQLTVENGSLLIKELQTGGFELGNLSREETYNKQNYAFNQPTITGAAGGTLPSGTVITYTDGNGTTADSFEALPQYMNARDSAYTATVTVTAPGHAARTETITLKINRAALTLNTKSGDKFAGEADPNFNDAANPYYTLEGLVTGDTAADVLGAITVSRTNPGTDLSGDLTAAVEKQAPYENYTLTSNPGLFTVTPLSTTMALSNTNRMVDYNGEGYTFDATTLSGLSATDNPADVVYTYTVNGSTYNSFDAIPKMTPAGTYEAQVTAKLRGYKDASATLTLQIRPAAISIKAKTAQKTDGLPDPTPFEFDIEGTFYTGDTKETVLGTVSVVREKVEGLELEAVGVHTSALVPKYDQSIGNTNYKITVLPADFTINPKGKITIDSKGGEATYDKNEHTIEYVRPSESDAIIKYKDPTTGEFTLDNPPKFVEVGEHEVEFEVKKDGFETATGKETVSIAARPVYVTVGNGWKYQGDADDLTGITVTRSQNGFLGSDDIQDVVVARNLLEADPEALGNHQKVLGITYTATEAVRKNYAVTVTNGDFNIIEKGKMTVSASNVNATYDGRAHYTVANVVGIEAAGAKIEYLVNGTYQDAYPTFVDAGSYAVEFRATKPGFTTATGTATVNIARRSANIVVSNYQRTVLEPDPANFSGTISDPLARTELTNVRYVRRNPTVNTVQVHTGEITATYTDAKGNYNVTVTDGTLTITNAGDLTVKAVGDNPMYDGAEHTIPAPSSNQSDVTFLYRVPGGEFTTTIPKYTNAGTYPVEIIARKEGYTDSQPITVNLSIRQRPVTINVFGGFKTEGENDPSFTGQIAGMGLINANDLGVITFGRGAGYTGLERAGDYIAVTAYYTPNPNYQVTVIDSTLVINPANNPVVPTPTPTPTVTPTPTATPTTPPTNPTPTPGVVITTPTPDTPDTTPDTTPTPDNPTPVAPDVPTAPTPAPAPPELGQVPTTPETVQNYNPNTPAPQVAAPLTVIGLDDQGNFTRDVYVQVDDEEVALANQQLPADHKCCILHFLLMLGTLVVTLFYTRSMKKRQAKIFELRKELKLDFAE